MDKTVDYYVNLPHRIEVEFDSEGECFAARIPDLPGCVAAAPSWEELDDALLDAKRAWIETALALGRHIPEPAREYSGRFVLRMPKWLHEALAEEASRQGVSLNQYVVTELAARTGHGVLSKRPPSRPRARLTSGASS